MEIILIGEIILLIVIGTLIFIFISILCKIKKIEKHIESFFEDLEHLKQNYITYKQYENLKIKYQDVYDQIKLDLKCFKKFKKIYSKLKKYVEIYNKEYVNNELIRNKEYFDALFDYKLDLEQRRAIIIDDDYNLIIAGAGSGKTTTIIGKTKYLIEQKGVNPEEILTVSFTNAAADNFKKNLNIDLVECGTIHKIGNNIISEQGVKSTVIEENYLGVLLNKYIKEVVSNDQQLLEIYIKICAYYIHLNPQESLDFHELVDLQQGCDFESSKVKI